MNETHEFSTSRTGRLPQSRRALLAGAGVTCAALLTGCTTYDANQGGFEGPGPSSAASSGSAA
ncbi:MAG: twin-arginine translocation signal domain-containing protein, partial [Trebonia sp.]